MSNSQVTLLDNGLQVITINLPIKTAVTAAFIKTGSRYESKEINGISHFLEHLAFKGSKKRTCFDIANEVESIGSEINAFTSKEVTAYFISSIPEHIETSVDIISDVVLNSQFPQAELDIERGVVLQEIARSWDDPMNLALDFADIAAYPDQSYGRTILGDPNFIENATREDFNAYVGKHYNSNNMFVICVGNVNHDIFVNLVHKYFASAPIGAVSVPQPAKYIGGYHHYNRDFEQANILLGFPSFTALQDHVVAEVLSGVLCGGMSSPLFIEVREKRGLVYSIFSTTQKGFDYGNFGIYAGTTSDLVMDCLQVTCAELKKLTSKIEEQDILRTKNQLISKLLMKQDRAFSVAYAAAEDFATFGKVIDIQEKVNQIKEVTVDQLKTAANTIFSSTPTLSIVGPIGPDDYYDYVKGLMQN